MVSRETSSIAESFPGSLLPPATELPPYEFEPKVEHVGVTPYYVPPAVAVVLDKKELGPEDFMTGDLVLHPTRRMGNINVTIEVIGQEQALASSALGIRRKELVTTRRIRLASTVIPISLDVKQNHRYTVPFSIKLPPTRAYRPCKSCENGSYKESPEGTPQPESSDSKILHLDFPPSLGDFVDILESETSASVTYFVLATIEGTVFNGMTHFKYFPKSADLDLSNFYSKKNHSLQREYNSSLNLSKRALFKNKATVDGTLTVTGTPIYHILKSSQTGKTTLKINLVPHGSNTSGEVESFEVSDLSIKVYKMIHGASRGMGTTIGKASGRSIREYKLSLGEIPNEYNLAKVNPTGHTRSNTLAWDLDIGFWLRDTPLLEIPSYVSCLTAVTYDMEISIKHNWGISKHRAPLVISRETAPHYSSSVVTMTSPPSLVSD